MDLAKHLACYRHSSRGVKSLGRSTRHRAMLPYQFGGPQHLGRVGWLLAIAAVLVTGTEGQALLGFGQISAPPQRHLIEAI